MNVKDKSLSKETLCDALEDLADRMEKKGKTAEINLYGGAVFVLSHQTRLTTLDVDYTLRSGENISEEIKATGKAKGLPSDWMNSGVKAFTMSKENPSHFERNQFFKHSNLTIHQANPDYLLAMKCMASRNVKDISDIKFLVKKIGIRSFKELEEKVTPFYPTLGIHPRFHAIQDELFKPEVTLERNNSVTPTNNIASRSPIR